MEVLNMKVSVDGVSNTTTRKENALYIESEFNALMYHKYIYKSKWVKRVKENTNYDSTRKIKFYLDNGCRYEFLIKE